MVAGSLADPYMFVTLEEAAAFAERKLAELAYTAHDIEAKFQVQSKVGPEGATPTTSIAENTPETELPLRRIDSLIARARSSFKGNKVSFQGNPTVQKQNLHSRNCLLIALKIFWV